MSRIIIFFMVLLPSFGFACEQPTGEFFYNVLNYKIPPSTWRTVKGSSYEANNSIAVVAVVERILENSYAIYKGETYKYQDHIDGVRFCKTASNRFNIIHPKYGTIAVTRTGNGDEALIKAQQGFLIGRARPIHMVIDVD